MATKFETLPWARPKFVTNHISLTSFSVEQSVRSALVPLASLSLPQSTCLVSTTAHPQQLATPYPKHRLQKMAEYASAAITAITATAAIVGSAGAYRQQDRIYRAWNSDEDSPWQASRPRQRAPFASTRSRHSYGYYGQPLYYPPGLHEHYVHHAECPGSQCHYRAFLTDSIQRYNESRRALRQTYVWNLRELSHIHESQPLKPARDKAVEAERLYSYYVSRVRAVFEEHRRDHQRLFGQDYLCWAAPEREDPALLQLRSSRMGSPGTAGLAVRDIVRGTPAPAPAPAHVIKEEEEGGEDCEARRKSKDGKGGRRGSRWKNRSKTKSASAESDKQANKHA
ncbi:hypothetical protein F4781DRAFT_445368 [Annulohypoxylon bovei var. microspora]|nr:hypothetical protein F4781DRAFT_445368 [Annulohypoxylon bovei var. microspora]